MMNSLHFNLRPYQQEAHSATISFVNNERGHGIMCASGGAGKSIMIARDAEYLHEQGNRVVVLADRAKLLEQNLAKFSTAHAGNVGLVSAGLGSFNYKAPIIVGGIQTLYDKQHLLGQVDWFLPDECNGVGNDFESDSRYHQLFRYYPHARILGYTATPFTLQEGKLNWGKIFHKIPYSKLVAEGWLVPLTNKIKDAPDLSGVAHSGKEYNLQSLAEFMSVPELVVKTAKSIAASIVGRKKGLVFCVDRKHAEEVTMALIREGVRADILLGTMPESQRAQKYEDFAGTYIDCLVNVEIATTGLDFPFVDWIACLRSTESLSLWHQILYRGVRLSPATGKKDCLLLDYSGNLQKHGGLMNQLWEYMGSTKKKIGKPIKVCPNCEGDNIVGSKECVHCGYEFLKEDVARELQHEEEADLTSDINKTDTLEKFKTITNISYSHHTASSGRQSLRVEYQSGKFYCSEFIPFGGKEFWEKRKCLDFIRPRSNLLPETIKEALELCADWRKPKIIKVRPQKNNPKYYEIMEVVKWA